MNIRIVPISAALLLLFASLVAHFSTMANAEKNPVLPAPFETPNVEKRSTIIGWPAGMLPLAPSGFTVEQFAELASPRSLYVMPNGDVLVSQSKKKPNDKGEDSPNQITQFKMDGSKLVSSSVFAQGLNLPFGMAMFNDEFFVAEPTRILKYRVADGALIGEPVVIATSSFSGPAASLDTPLLLSPDGAKLYVAVGSASNVGEDGDPLDPRTAAVLEMNRDGTEQKVFAGGLRNPVSLAWEPTTGSLWAVVNERDGLGDDLVPDYITAVRRDGFYGWPYSYWGQNMDPRLDGRRRDLVEQSLRPDFSVGPHTAALGITFTTGSNMPAPFSQGALISQHGSWNRSSFTGYKVLYVPFLNGQAEDGERDFLSGFIADDAAGTVYGRPVSSVVLRDGSVLVADDGAGKIWRVTHVATKNR